MRSLAAMRSPVTAETQYAGGFISDLPTTLIAAFRATLEEVTAADVILHVRDIASPDTAAQKANVEHVLSELGVDTESQDIPLMEVWNKTDLLDTDDKASLVQAVARHKPPAYCVSAVTGDGIAHLTAALDAQLGRNALDIVIQVAVHEGAFINWLYENTHVVTRDEMDTGEIRLHLLVPDIKADVFHRHLASAMAKRIES